MARYFLDLKDKRVQFIKGELLKRGVEIFDFDALEEKPKKNDVVIVSPAFKWNELELNKLTNSITVFGGKLPEDFNIALKQSKPSLTYFNFMLDDDFVLKNAVYTAEGFLSELISNTKTSIYEQKILILGSGRIAKSVEYLLNKFGVNFDVAMRNEKEINFGKLIAKKSFHLKEMKEYLQEYDTIINTIPSQIFSEDDLLLFSKNCVIFELASKSCFGNLSTQNLNYIWSSVLPSKYMPNSAGKLMLDFVDKKISF